MATHRNLLEMSKVGVAVVDAKLRQVVYVNPALASITGFAESQLLGMTLEDLFPANEQRRPVVPRGSVDEERRITRPDGTERAVLLTYDRDDSTQPGPRILVLVHDVTRKSNEQAVGRERREFRTLCSLAGAGVVEADTEGRILYVNPAWCQMVGYTEDELLQKNVLDLTSPESHQTTKEALARLWQGSDIVAIEKNYRRRDGSQLQAISTVTPIRNSAGAMEGIVAVVVDVGAQLGMRTQLQEHQQLLSLALRAANAGAWDYDPGTGTIRFLEGMAGLLGLPADTSALGPGEWVKYMHPDDRDRVAASFRHIPRVAGTHWTERFRVIRVDGEMRWLASRGVVVPAEGSDVKIVGIDVDITELKEAEERLSAADRQKDQFLATLAHELRNPLAPISSGLHLLRRTQTSQDAHRLSTMMERQLRHIVHLIDDLMDVSRVNSGKVQLNRLRVDLRKVVEGAIEAMRATEARAIDSHELRVDMSNRPVWVDADATRLAQVTGNLLSNATKYTPAGGHITVSVRQQRHEAVLSVADTGVGLPANQIEEVFKMFTQVNRTLNRAQGGLGIGLALAKTFVEMHGGRLHAHSAGEGLGSTFTVRLPVAPTQAHAQPRSPKESVRHSRSPQRVLVIDDNEDAANTLAELLSALGHRVEVAYGGEDGIARAKSFLPSVAFIDLGLPDIDGFEVTRQLRRVDALQGSYLVALTGWGAAADQARCEAAGFDQHLTKPANAAAIEDVIDRAVVVSRS